MRLTTPEISWHGKEPLFSLDFSSNMKSPRLATSGADSNIRIWAILPAEDNGSKVQFMANLSRHTKAVNVVRFSPQGNMLASGGDDCYVIIWKLNEENMDGFSSYSNSDDIEEKESWQVVKMLRGHIEDVYDLAWSPNGTRLISGSVDNSVIIWDTSKGEKLEILRYHRQYVQGVCWDPCGKFVASYSCDRTCRIYNTSNFKCCYNVNKMALPNSCKTEQGKQSAKHMKMFHDETMPSFFRRLTFSPDGLLFLVPGGKFEVSENKTINTTYVFTKASMNKPVLYFPATKNPTIAVKCCPVLFELRNTAKNNMENKQSVFKLPYRMVIAVASLDTVVLYDTQRTMPFAFVSNIHYASLTDIAWSSDGQILAISSRDGYCSLVTFDENELGIPYSKTAREVIENATVNKEISPGKRNVVTPKSKTTSDSMKEERAISPKIEKLSIKNFATVNPAKPASRQPAALKADSIQDGGQKTTGPRRVGFVTIQAKRETQPTAQNSSPPSTTSPVPMATDSTATQSHRVEIDRVSPQQRRVSFVTLTSPQASKNPLVKTAPTVQDEKITQTGTASDSNPSTNNTSSVTTVKNTLTRENRPPVPLEPTVIIINE